VGPQQGDGHRIIGGVIDSVPQLTALPLTHRTLGRALWRVGDKGNLAVEKKDLPVVLGEVDGGSSQDVGLRRTVSAAARIGITGRLVVAGFLSAVSV
jgi:hypothetical protein